MGEKLLTLNSEQLEAKIKITEFIKDPNKKYITVSGPGGSGKTFMLKEAIKQYDSSRVIGATISHFAKEVLKKSLGENIQVFTIAKLLNKRMIYDSESGEPILVASGAYNQALNFADILIIDEVSMIDDILFKELLALNIKIIAVGDKYQLAPVEQEHDSKFFDTIDVELKTVMRFTGPIKFLSKLFISEIGSFNDGYSIDKYIINKETSRTSDIDDNGSGYIFLKGLNSVIKLVVSELKKDMTSTDSCRIIAYKNNTINYINGVVRKSLFGKNLNKFEVGELIISEGGYRREITNGSIFRIKKLTKAIGPHGIPCYILTLDSELVNPVYVVSEDGQNEYDQIEEYLKTIAIRERNFASYKDFVESFANFNYSYAVNVYKVQGSSINNVYILEDEIMGIRPIGMKQKFQSMYVAVTRARHRVYIYNKNYNVNNSHIDIINKRFIDGSS